MTNMAARRLLRAVAEKQIPAETAVYIADCIVASDDIDFADEATREAVFFLEDDTSKYLEDRHEIWTREEILGALALLG